MEQASEAREQSAAERISGVSGMSDQTGQKSHLQNSLKKKKKWTHPRFLHRGPKKAVEQDSDVHFDLT